MALVSNAACNVRQTDPQVTVEQPYIAISNHSPTMARLYFRARTNNNPSKLVRIEVPAADAVVLRSKEGVFDSDDSSFSPDKPLVFGPGGNHAVLTGLDRSMNPQATVQVVFHFEPAPPVIESVAVRLE